MTHMQTMTRDEQAQATLAADTIACPNCGHGIDPHGTDPGGTCGVGSVTERGDIDHCPCLLSPNAIAHLLLTADPTDAEVVDNPTRCPECRHDINWHGYEFDFDRYMCGGTYGDCNCDLSPSDIARALLAAEPTDAQVTPTPRTAPAPCAGNPVGRAPMSAADLPKGETNDD